METIFITLALLVSGLHLFFFLLESYFWTKPLGLKVFRQSLEAAEASRVLALNQGFYNGILAVGLLWGLFDGDSSITLFCLVAVVIAGIVGAATVSPRIFIIQSLPAILALVASYLS